jgi:hypothetical protein
VTSVVFALVVEHRRQQMFSGLYYWRLVQDLLSREFILAAASSVQAVSLPLGRSQFGAGCVGAF